ncbi:MAG: M61 family metallopeptidase [Cytophagales bacterium]|nr:M61 family metallopeptidase [Cytophagales bacterium]
MIKYTISTPNPLNHTLFVEIELESTSSETFLQLASWRPGRYELANYAQNIRNVQSNVSIEKTSKDQWKLSSKIGENIILQYEYYAFQLDAGNSYVDENQVYINFINCLPAIVGREEEEIRLNLNIPSEYQIACSLQEAAKHELSASSYYELADSPMIASDSLQHKVYDVEGAIFHLWMQGEYDSDWEKILADFIPFTKENIDVFNGEFPCDNYHFLIQILPYRYYHGVEHSNSTVIVLGEEKGKEENFYNDFLGVSCHELFHTWNICRIRPKEMMPYDYSKEAYFDTGFVAEGVTTYYGDYLLARSGVFSEEQYFKELNTLFKRHFYNDGRLNASLAESSADLWLDGYKLGVPQRKVSIYVKGALIAFYLDLTIREKTAGQKSLDDLMRLMWERFGKTKIGYSAQDYQECVAELIGHDFAQQYMQDYVYGVLPLEQSLTEVLESVGCIFQKNENPLPYEGKYGFRVIKKEGKLLIHQIAKGSSVEHLLSIGDELQEEELMKLGEESALNIVRYGKQKTIELPSHTTHQYYPIYEIVKNESATQIQQERFEQWLNKSFI